MAKTQPYKGHRKNPKPFHFYNILAYLRANYDVRIAVDGLEADDLICKIQYTNQGSTSRCVPTTICSRDKDLRICPGWHYSWECGGQAAIGPFYTDELGFLEEHIIKKPNGKKEKKVFGAGKAFFYYQMLVGDAADHIPGLQGYGHVKAMKLLSDCKTEQDYFNVVKTAYKDTLGDKSKEHFVEQSDLLWMRMNGSYKIPKEG